MERLSRKSRNLLRMSKEISQLKGIEKQEIIDKQSEFKKEADIFTKVDIGTASDFMMERYDEVKNFTSEAELESYFNNNSFKLDSISLGKLWFFLEQKKRAEKPVVENIKNEEPAREEMPVEKQESITAGAINKFWVVTKKVSDASDISDVLFESSPSKIGLQYEGGLKNHEIVGFYDSYEIASEKAEKVLKGENLEDNANSESKPLSQPEVKDSINSSISASDKKASVKVVAVEKDDTVERKDDHRKGVVVMKNPGDWITVQWEDGRQSLVLGESVTVTQSKPKEEPKKEEPKERVIDFKKQKNTPEEVNTDEGKELKTAPIADEEVQKVHDELSFIVDNIAVVEGEVKKMKAKVAEDIKKYEKDNSKLAMVERRKELIDKMATYFDKSNSRVMKFASGFMALFKRTRTEGGEPTIEWENSKMKDFMEKKGLIKEYNDYYEKAVNGLKSQVETFEDEIMRMWEDNSSTKKKTGAEDTIGSFNDLYELSRTMAMESGELAA